MRLKKLKLKYLLLFVSLICLSSLLKSNQTNAYNLETFRTPSPTTLTIGLTSSNDGSLWFIKINEKQLVRIDDNGLMTEYDISQIVGDGLVSQLTINNSGKPMFTISSQEASPSREIKIVTMNPDGQTSFVTTTVPATANNNDDSGFRMPGIVASADGKLFIYGNGVNNASPIVMKIEPSTGAVIDFWEPSGPEPGTFMSAQLDNQGNLWVAPSGKLVRISTNGQMDTFPLDNIGFAHDIEVDNENNVWMLPNAKTFFNQPNVVVRMNSAEQISYYNLEPQGSIANFYGALSKSPEGQLFISTMTIGTENDTLGRAYLYRLYPSGDMDKLIDFEFEDYPLSLEFGINGKLWGLFITPAQDINDLNFRVGRFIQDFSIPPNALITPAAPKSGNTATFIVITSIVAITFLLFSLHLHRRHIRSHIQF